MSCLFPWMARAPVYVPIVQNLQKKDEDFGRKETQAFVNRFSVEAASQLKSSEIDLYTHDIVAALGKLPLRSANAMSLQIQVLKLGQTKELVRSQLVAKLVPLRDRFPKNSESYKIVNEMVIDLIHAISDDIRTTRKSYTNP